MQWGDILVQDLSILSVWLISQQSHREKLLGTFSFTSVLDRKIAGLKCASFGLDSKIVYCHLAHIKPQWFKHRSKLSSLMVYHGKLDILKQRCNFQLCSVTLSLFDTLVSLNCEDVMLWLVFRHLIPMNHILLSQRNAIRHPGQ